MNEELQALHHILQKKQQKGVPTDNGWARSTLPTFWLVQGEDHLFTPEELQSLQRSNTTLHRLNGTLAQFQMTMFKKLVDITKPGKRPEKQTQTKTEWRDTKRELELQQVKEKLVRELDQLSFELSVANEKEKITQARYDSLKVWVRMTEQHHNSMSRLLEQAVENQALLLQVGMLEEELRHRRSVALRAKR